MRRVAVACAVFLAAAEMAFPKVLAVTVNHVVHPITVEILGKAIRQAEQEHASLLLIRLNTPGGLLEATRESIEKIVSSPVPVVTYVCPSGGRAASAGFFLLEAGDVAAMAPGTNTGAASPVLLGEKMDPILRRKAEEDAAAALRSLVDKRGRNSALAQKTVSEAKAFTEKEALDNRLIELIARNEQDLLGKLQGREVTRLDGRKQRIELKSTAIVEYELNLRERLVTAISDPNIAFIILVIGALGVYAEFSSPGMVLPGVAGGILVLLGLSALSVLPINWGAAGLLVLAIVLFILEAKIASHGVLGTGGAVAMVLGAVLLIDAPPELRIRWPIAVSVAVPFALITVFLVSLVLKARIGKVLTGSAGLVGTLGVARTPLAPEGKVFVDGTYWDAVASAPVEAGARIRVTAVDGLMLQVEPVRPSSGGSHV